MIAVSVFPSACEAFETSGIPAICAVMSYCSVALQNQCTPQCHSSLSDSCSRVSGDNIGVGTTFHKLVCVGESKIEVRVPHYAVATE